MKKTKSPSRPLTTLASTLLVFGVLGLSLLNSNQSLTPIAEQLPSIEAPVSNAPTDDVSDSSSDIPVTVNNNRFESTIENPSEKENLQQTGTQLASTAFVREKVLGDSIITSRNESFPIREYKTQVTPNDPYAEQWWTTSARLPELWDTNTGNSDTILAIIDTGFALNHEEFQGRWATNMSEQGPALLQNPSTLNCSDRAIPLDKNCNLIDDNYDGIVDNETGITTAENPSKLNCTDQAKPIDRSCNQIDDDNNGLIDDWRGWDFVSFDNSVQAGEIDPNGSGTKHGTYVTGVAAANANNNVGIAGVNWNTRVLPIQALADTGSGTTLGVARGIRYAVAQGADVISLSLGSNLPDSYTRQAVQEAIAAGVIVVAASGNDGCDCISYPANYPEVVAVGALTASNTRASFSSYGENIDILAPGVNLYTATWGPSNGTSAYAGGINGTSLATPLVSAMITSLIGQDPSLSPRELISVLTENTNRLSLPSNSEWSNTLGFGTLDGFTANNRLSTPYSAAQITTFTPISYGNRLNPSAPFEPTSTTKLYQCAPDDYGTTRLYRLKKNSVEFYSVSNVEIYFAENSGYSKTFFGFVCANLPFDTPQSIRNLNVYREFSNINPKL